ncbi:cytidine deaminase [Danaus plexippus plexippus]|uniref:Cytidine deaminase n=1 Tax=Danaus plexippus plexippus TaxID=278856 RepID=A0A212F6S8_DANPL|nr:cytidine deaminase [Danaus plexippus plexippus]
MEQYDIVDFSSLGETAKQLIQEAAHIRQRAYCPYSNFAVGAAILTEEDERMYTGCNIESSTLTPTICAERAAVPRAVCDGYTKFKMVAVVAHQKETFTAPCGVCRQVLSEFRSSDGDIEIYLSKPTMDKILCTKMSKLLPLSFVSYKIDSVT